MKNGALLCTKNLVWVIFTDDIRMSNIWIRGIVIMGDQVVFPSGYHLFDDVLHHSRLWFCSFYLLNFSH